MMHRYSARHDLRSEIVRRLYDLFAQMVVAKQPLTTGNRIKVSSAPVHGCFGAQGALEGTSNSTN
jgi:hypothetical protein